MDLSMPVMGGEKASEEILKFMRHAQLASGSMDHPGALTSIVAVTSHTNQKIKESCLKVGMKAVFTKPLNLQDLRTVMEEYFYS